MNRNTVHNDSVRDGGNKLFYFLWTEINDSLEYKEMIHGNSSLEPNSFIEFLTQAY